MTDSDHIIQLRQQVANLHGLLVKAKAERDEARREVCNLNAEEYGATPEHHADGRGWNCFKENP